MGVKRSSLRPPLLTCKHSPAISFHFISPTAAKWLSISLLIIFVQCWVLSTIVDESSYARCVDHDDCHIGEFCAPSPLNQRINPGACHDCYVTTLPMSRIETEIYWLYVDDPTYWSSAVSHCTSTDTLPLRCDFLVHNRLMLSGGGVLVLLFSAVVALIPTVADLDQAADERAVMSERGLYKKKSSPIHVSTRALLYISHTSRVHFVPLLVVAATVGLLIADSLNSQNFLLNGLAVGESAFVRLCPKLSIAASFFFFVFFSNENTVALTSSSIKII